MYSASVHAMGVNIGIYRYFRKYVHVHDENNPHRTYSTIILLKIYKPCIYILGGIIFLVLSTV